MAPDDASLFDPATALLWEPTPSPDPVGWEAAAAADADGWRLPTVAELMTFLVSRGIMPAAPGVVFWASSASPFASADYVRAVTGDAASRWTVMLLAKSDQAWRWRVRD